MNNDEKYSSMLEVLLNIFTVDKGEIKVLLFKKNSDPYKGYWMLPSSLLFSTETIEHCANDTLNNMIGLEDVYLEQHKIYSDVDRVSGNRIIGCSMIGLVDMVRANFQREEIPGFESEWFNINTIPKTVGDHGIVVNNAIVKLKKEILNSNMLKLFFPSDFTLPELQKIYEQVLEKELDRRNFRKKFLNLEIIELTGDKNDGLNGRPANLYRFKEEVEEKNLF